MEQNNLYKKLRFVALCLAIVCMALSLIKRAKAESMNDYYINIINGYLNDSNISPDLNNIYNECEYFTILSDASKFNYNIYFSNNINVSGRLETSSYTWSYSANRGQNAKYGAIVSPIVINNTDSQNIKYYVLQVSGNSYRISNVFTSRALQNSINVNPILYQNWSNGAGIGSIANNGNVSTFNIDSSKTISNYDNYFYVDSPESTLHILKNVDAPTNNTDGLKVYKQTIHNTSFLYIDYSECVNIVPTYLETSSVIGNIDIDGTIYEIDYDNSSQYYHINIGTGKVYYQIPFSALSLTDSNIESAILNNLEVSVSWSTTLSQGNENLIWITPLYLIGSPHETPGYTPDSSNEQPAQTYNPEMNSDYYLNIYSMYHDGHTGNPFKYDDNINIYSSHQLAIDSIKLDADIFEMDTWYINSSDKTLYASNTDLFGDYIYDNGFGLYYDAIVFDVYDRHVDGVVSPVNVYKGTGVLFTEKYYTRNGLMSITDSLKDVIQYDHMCSDYLYLLYDVTWKKLKSIDYNIADYFTKQGNVTSQIILMLENINSFLPDMNGLLNDILNALKNLQLSQLDTIDTKLSTIIDNITTPKTPFNEDDTVAEAIKYYEKHNNNGVPTGQVYLDDKMSIWISGKVHLWLQGSDANSDKTSLINSVFETLTSIYDSMKNNNDIFPNIQYYLDAIAKNNNYAYETHGDYMTRFFKGNVDISTYNGISE